MIDIRTKRICKGWIGGSVDVSKSFVVVTITLLKNCERTMKSSPMFGRMCLVYQPWTLVPVGLSMRPLNVSEGSEGIACLVEVGAVKVRKINFLISGGSTKCNSR